MSISRFADLPAALVLLAATLGTGQVSAQYSADQPAPPPYRSALEGYQPYTDEKIVNWKEANDNTGRIGGWREYAKEASEPQTREAALKPDPAAAPAGRPSRSSKATGCAFSSPTSCPSTPAW